MISNTPLRTPIGNEDGLARMERAAVSFHNPNLPKPRIALLGGTSVGKTFFARWFGQQVDVPFCELQPHAVRSILDVHNAMISACGQRQWTNRTAPEMVIFFDEVHVLGRNIMDGLLKALETSDCIMVSEEGDAIDCRNVGWLIATTSVGELTGPMLSRFSQIELDGYSRDEIAQIVALNYPRMNIFLCAEISRMCGLVPREALLFAAEVQAECDQSGDALEAVIARVARQNKIDEHGLSQHRLAVLEALGQGPISAVRLAGEIGVEKKQLEKFVLPPMQSRTDDRIIPWVTICSQGLCITQLGLAQLDLRSLSHRGDSAMPKAIRRKYEALP